MIGMDIHEFLVKKGITAVRLADLVEITAVQLSRIINGRSMPSRITMEKIAKVLDVNISFSSDNNQWSLIPKVSGIGTGPKCKIVSNNASNITDISQDFREVIPIPFLNISDLSHPDISDISEMESFLTKISNFIPVLLKDLGIIKSLSPFAVIMNSESMYDAGIPYGAYAVVNPCESIYNGDSVLVKWGIQEDISIRWFFKYSDCIKLCSSNPEKYPPIILNTVGNNNEDETDGHKFFHIYGKVMVVYTIPHRGI